MKGFGSFFISLGNSPKNAGPIEKVLAGVGTIVGSIFLLYILFTDPLWYMRALWELFIKPGIGFAVWGPPG